MVEKAVRELTVTATPIDKAARGADSDRESDRQSSKEKSVYVVST